MPASNRNMIVSIFFFIFTALVSAYTQPTDQTWGPIYLPDTTHPVTQGEAFNITWDNPAGRNLKGVTVRGPGSNCVLQPKAIVEKIPARQKHYLWNVPENQRPGRAGTNKGNGMLIIVDGTGEFQYSTQFSVLRG